MKVLIAEDDGDQLDLLAYALRREGYSIVTALDGQRALAHWEEDRPDIVLLDANLPKLSGFEVCRHMRTEAKTTPLIMLTARDEEEDVLRAFRLGADDYVVKPFSPKQLIARMRAVLRRYNSAEQEPARQLRIGDITLDLQSYVAIRGDLEIQLTRLEFRILWLLAANVGRVIPHSRLVEYAWGYDGGDSSLLKTHICHIREKLGLSTGRNGAIRAVPGIGYSLSEAPSLIQA